MTAYLSLIAILISVVGLLVQYFAVIVRILDRLARLETKTELWWKAVEGGVVGMLKTYPTDIGKDVLLDRMTRGELDLDAAQRLRTILQEEMELANAPGMVLAHVLALGRLEQLLYDLNNGR